MAAVSLGRILKDQTMPFAPTVSNRRRLDTGEDDMPLRRRRPVARVATTAVVAGTAAHMGAKAAQKSAAAQAEPAPAAPAAAEPAAPQAAEGAQIEELKQLAALRDQGILSEEEFTAKKAQLLGI